MPEVALARGRLFVSEDEDASTPLQQLEAIEMTPPRSLARDQALAKWRDLPEPMLVQMQQGRPYQQQLMQQQHGSSSRRKPISKEQAEQIRKELEKKGQVLPDGQKKKPLSGEIAGAA